MRESAPNEGHKSPGVVLGCSAFRPQRLFGPGARFWMGEKGRSCSETSAFDLSCRACQFIFWSSASSLGCRSASSMAALLSLYRAHGRVLWSGERRHASHARALRIMASAPRKTDRRARVANIQSGASCLLTVRAPQIWCWLCCAVFAKLGAQRGAEATA